MATGSIGYGQTTMAKSAYTNQVTAKFKANVGVTRSKSLYADSPRPTLKRTPMKFRLKTMMLRLCGFSSTRAKELVDSQMYGDEPKAYPGDAVSDNGPDYTENPLCITVHTVQGGRIIMSRVWDRQQEVYRRSCRIIHEDSDLGTELRDMIVVNELVQ